MNIKRLGLFWLISCVVLLVPFLAMQFTEEVNWSLSDYLIAWGLLFSTSFIVNLLIDKVTVRSKRYALIALVLIALFLLWAEMAVGIFGTPIAGS